VHPRPRHAACWATDEHEDGHGHSSKSGAGIRRGVIDTGRTAFDEVFPADAVFVHPSTPVIGSAQVAELLATVRAAFPDAKHTITRVLAADGFAALEGTWIGTHTATHTATLRTTHGEVPATGLRVSTPFASLVRVSGTHIGAVHVHTDQVSFAAQLGLLPAPA